MGETGFTILQANGVNDAGVFRSFIPRKVPGVIAEEVEDAGLGMFCEYDENGELTGVMYDRLPLLLIPIVKDLVERIKKLEERE